jgi:hypothetical protein
MIVGRDKGGRDSGRITLGTNICNHVWRQCPEDCGGSNKEGSSSRE